MSDPAFLFYSKDFYTDTRTMLPKERACLLDLMIYQHQNEYIPNDIERISLFCTGVDEATLKATLKAKFKLCDKGWYNGMLKDVIEKRAGYSEEQSNNGLVGQFFKKAKSSLGTKRYNELKTYIYTNFSKDSLVEELKKEGSTHEGVLEALLKHLANENENENENENKIEIDFEGLKNYWNSNCGKCPKVKEFTNARKEAIKKILITYSKQDLMRAISIVKNSNFLQGENENGWVATIDFFVNKKNFIKIIEGNYNNKQGVSKEKLTIKYEDLDEKSRN